MHSIFAGSQGTVSCWKRPLLTRNISVMKTYVNVLNARIQLLPLSACLLPQVHPVATEWHMHRHTYLAMQWSSDLDTFFYCSMVYFWCPYAICRPFLAVDQGHHRQSDRSVATASMHRHLLSSLRSVRTPFFHSQPSLFLRTDDMASHRSPCTCHEPLVSMKSLDSLLAILW